MLHLQRVGVAESPIERSIANGPLRAWSKGNTEYSMTFAYVSCTDMIVSMRVWQEL